MGDREALEGIKADCPEMGMALEEHIRSIRDSGGQLPPHKPPPTPGEWFFGFCIKEALVGFATGQAVGFAWGRLVGLAMPGMVSGEAVVAPTMLRFRPAAPAVGPTRAAAAALAAPRHLTANPRNLVSRQGPSEMTGNKVKRYTRSMKESGFDPTHPIKVADVAGRKIIIDGHHRAAAAVRAGLPEVPITLTPVTGEEAAKLAEEAAQAAAERSAGQW